MTTPLRQKLIEDLQLHGLSTRTQEMYVLSVRQLADYYRKSPDQLSEAELRNYFLYLKNVKKVAPSTLTIALCGIKFFFEYSLNRRWVVFELIRPPHENKLPVVLSVDEVRSILACVRRLRYQVCLSAIYACGLRLQEGVHLQVGDVDSQRMVVHVQRGKGSKDRIIPLNDSCRKAIKEWCLVRSIDNINRQFTTQRGCATTRAIQTVLESIGKAARVENMTPHVARHTFAKNQINAGVSLEKVAMLLGHSSLDTTMVYITPGMSDLDKAVRSLDG